MNHDEALLTASELSNRLGIATSTVNRWRVEGRVPYVRLSKRTYRFRWHEVIEALENQQLATSKAEDRQ